METVEKKDAFCVLISFLCTQQSSKLKLDHTLSSLIFATIEVTLTFFV